MNERADPVDRARVENKQLKAIEAELAPLFKADRLDPFSCFLSVASLQTPCATHLLALL